MGIPNKECLKKIDNLWTDGGFVNQGILRVAVVGLIAL